MLILKKALSMTEEKYNIYICYAIALTEFKRIRYGRRNV